MIKTLICIYSVVKNGYCGKVSGNTKMKRTINQKGLRLMAMGLFIVVGGADTKL